MDTATSHMHQHARRSIRTEFFNIHRCYTTTFTLPVFPETWTFAPVAIGTNAEPGMGDGPGGLIVRSLETDWIGNRGRNQEAIDRQKQIVM